MKARTLLILLQLAGAVTLLLYPGVLVAGVMGLAAPGGPGGAAELAWKAFLLVSLAYPALWIVLWGLSWWALRAGRTTLAALLSLPPVLVLGAAAVLLVAGSLWQQRFASGVRGAQGREVEHARAQNPLAGALLGHEAGKTSWAELERAIQAADPDQLSRPVERLPMADMIPGLKVDTPPGASPPPTWRTTPLLIAVQASGLERAHDTAKARPRSLDAIRMLLARGARLSPEEEDERPQDVWLLEVVGKGHVLPDPRAAQENPLAWRLATVAPVDEHTVGSDVAEAAHRTPELLSRPTRTYGTPLRVAITHFRRDRVEDLLASGAQLSAEEQRVPSLVRYVEKRLALPQNAWVREWRAKRLRGEPVVSNAGRAGRA